MVGWLGSLRQVVSDEAPRSYQNRLRSGIATALAQQPVSSRQERVFGRTSRNVGVSRLQLVASCSIGNESVLYRALCY